MGVGDGGEMPAIWRAALLPRRGGTRVAAPTVGPGVPDRMRQLLGGTELWGVPAESDYHPELRVAAQRFARQEELTAPGAAATALFLGDAFGEHCADVWVVEGGVVFAARAAAELAGMVFDPKRRGHSLVRRSLAAELAGPERRQRTDDEDVLWAVARQVRAHLATASEEDYAAAVSALGDYRNGTPAQRITTAFLAPDRADWVAEDIADPRRAGRVRALLVYAAGTVEQHHRLTAAGLTLPTRWITRRALIGSLIDTLGGPAAVSVLAAVPAYRQVAGLDGMDDREALDALLDVPADDVLRLALRQTLDGRPSEVHGLRLLTRHPERTLRILAEDDAPFLAPDVLAMLSPTHPRAGDGSRIAELLDRYDLPGRPRYGTRHLTGAADRKRAIAWLAAIPTDTAFALLAARADRRQIRPELAKAAARHPVRAMRVLATLEPESPEARTVVAEMLRHHVLNHPALVGELDPAVRARVADLGVPAPAGPTAEADALPAPLRVATRAKALPAWLTVPALPPVRLRDSDVVLPEPAVRELLTLLSRSTFAVPHPGLTDVRHACDRASLAAFGWALFAQWQAADHPAGDRHAMFGLAFLGDDSTVPAISALFGGWAFGAAGRVRSGLEVLGAIGTDLALTHLQQFARKAKQPGFRRLAEEKLRQIAAARDLSTGELADRIVPGFGADADGRITLDFGPRRFTVTFDQRLNLLVSDADGRRLKGLPRVNAADDAALAEATKRTFADLRKEAKAVAAERLRTFEEAMVTGRSWSAADFDAFIVGHPVVRHIARTLLWRVVDGPAFRIAEDSSLADIDDLVLTLTGDQRVTVLHPASAPCADWVEVLADYEIFQPFPQAEREVHRLTPAQAVAAALPDVHGAQTTDSALYALTARGWSFGDGHGGVERAWPGGQVTRIGFTPAYDPRWSPQSEPRTLTDITVSARGGATFADLDPIAASEVLREAHRLAA